MPVKRFLEMNTSRSDATRLYIDNAIDEFVAGLLQAT